MIQKNVFKLWQSMDDYNDTQLYGKLNGPIDWNIVREIAAGTKDLSAYKPFHFKLKLNKILKKDLIEAPVAVQVISQKFKDFFDASVFGDSILLPCTINDSSYYIWIFTNATDCLNYEESQLEAFKYNEQGEQVPCKYVFDQDKIADYRFFKLANSTYEVYYCDELIGRKLLASDLNLMSQPLVFEEKDLRKRFDYNNTYFNIKFTELKNYHLECKQLEKIKTNKVLTEKDWLIDFKKNESEIGLLSLYRWQLLISTNSMQKAEILIGLTTLDANAYFEYRGTTLPHEFKHQDLHFEARIHQYDWQVVLVAPFKNNYNLYILVINRTHYATDSVYMQEAFEVVKNIKFA